MSHKYIRSRPDHVSVSAKGEVIVLSVDETVGRKVSAKKERCVCEVTT